MAAVTYYDAGAKALPLQQAGGTARSMAMGSAVVAVSQGSASLLWNPAGLSRMNCTEVGVHHNSGLGDTIQETAIVGTPLGEVKDNCGGSDGGIAASFNYVNYGSFDGRDTIGLPTKGYTPHDFAGSLGWGKELFPKFSGGLVLKTYQAQFPGKAYSTYAADLGVLYNIIPSLDLGLTYSNLNLGAIGNSIGELASGFRLGAGWTVDKHLLLAASGELQNKAMNRLQVGAEYLIGNTEEKANVLALRAGYQVNFPDPQLSGLTGLTFGLGYTLTRAIVLDYAMVPVGDLGDSHWLSLTMKFSCPDKTKAPAAAAPEPVRYVGALGPKPRLVGPAPKVRVLAKPAPKAVVIKEITLEDSYFDFDSAALRPQGMAALNENIQLLADNPKRQVEVAGYTSIRGTEEYNQLLSERRAAAVSDYLIAEGIDPDRISIVGYGEMRPAVEEKSASAANMDSAAAKANMRVVLTVYEP